MSGMFQEALSFNQPIGNWNTGNVENMSEMFYKASLFNHPIENWSTGKVNNMIAMFYEAETFNKPIGNWNTNNVQYMSSMFYGALNFNQSIENWNTVKVASMSRMFQGASMFNQPISNWSTQNVTSMNNMFSGTVNFNQPIGNWNTNKVTNMSSMFENATAFNQPLDNWTLNPTVSLTSMFNNSGIDCINYSATLTGWANNPNTPNGRSLGARGRSYGTNAAAARQALIAKGWTISGDLPSSGTCLPCTPPSISSQPAGDTVVVGSSVNFSVGFSGTSPSFEWKRGTTVLPQFTSSSASLSQVLVADQGVYTVKVSNNCGTVNSNGALLTVTPKPISIIGINANNKVYDGNNSTTLSGGSLSGLLSIHSNSVNFSGSATFNNKNVGNNKPINTSLTLTGVDASNYQLVQPTGLAGNVSPLTLTVQGSFTVVDKEFDGTSNAEIKDNNLILNGAINGDNVDILSVSTQFEDETIGINKKAVITSIVLTGLDAQNYNLDFSDLPFAIGEIKKNADKEVSFTLYPNPASNFFKIKGIEGAELELLDIRGALIRKMPITEEIGIADLSSGIYFVKITSPNFNKLVKLFVAK